MNKEQHRHDDSRLEREMKRVYDETLRLGYAEFVQLAVDVRDRGRSLGELTHAQSLEVIRAGEHLWQKLGTPRRAASITRLWAAIAITIGAALLAAIAAIASGFPAQIGQ